MEHVQAEEETPRYGLTRGFDSQNPIKVWFSEWPQLIRDIKAAKNLRQAMSYVFKPPGWDQKR